jgi:hypothetical protein
MLPTSPRLHTEPKLRERQRSSKIRGDLKACSAVTCYQLSAVVAWCCNSCALEHLLHVAHVSTSIDCSNIFQYSSWGQILLFSSQSGGSQASEGATPFSTKSKVVFWRAENPPAPQLRTCQTLSSLSYSKFLVSSGWWHLDPGLARVATLLSSWLRWSWAEHGKTTPQAPLPEPTHNLLPLSTTRCDIHSMASSMF